MSDNLNINVMSNRHFGEINFTAIDPRSLKIKKSNSTEVSIKDLSLIFKEQVANVLCLLEKRIGKLQINFMKLNYVDNTMINVSSQKNCFRGRIWVLLKCRF